SQPVNTEKGRSVAEPLERYQRGRVLMGRAPIEQLGEMRNGRSFSQGRRGQRSIKDSVKVSHQTGRRQRVAPQLKKIVRHADRSDAQLVLPNGSQSFFQIGARRDITAGGAVAVRK